MWDCDNYINKLVEQAKIDLADRINILFISALCSLDKEETDASFIKDNIESYLKKRGYTQNYVLGNSVMVKGFTVANVQDNHIEIWHDKTNNSNRLFINESYLTYLPIALNYFETI